MIIFSTVNSRNVYYNFFWWLDSNRELLVSEAICQQQPLCQLIWHLFVTNAWVDLSTGTEKDFLSKTKTIYCCRLIFPPSTSYFLGKVGLNFAFGSNASCCSWKTVWWRPVYDVGWGGGSMTPKHGFLWGILTEQKYFDEKQCGQWLLLS